MVVRCGEDEIRFRLGVTEARLGSGIDCDIYLPFPGVSRLHAVLLPTVEGPVLLDQNSKNGVLVEGRRVEQVVLRPGVVARFGQATVFADDDCNSDVDIGLALRRPPKRAGQGHETEELNSSKESTGSESGAEVLRFIRDLEDAKRLPADTTGAEYLARGRRILGAQSILVFVRDGGGEAGARLAAVDGPEPDGKTLARLGAKTKTGDPGQKTSEIRIGGRSILRYATPGDTGGSVAAVFPPGADLRQWQRDLFEFVAEHLSGGRPTRKLASPAKPVPYPSLVFPPGMTPGESPAISGLLRQIARTVSSRLDVLLLGETGTGKELFARMIHASGPTPGGPFVAINCAAIPSELLEAELFGIHGRTATGVDAHSGRFLEADGGTLFLDEIGDMAPTLQAKILRFLQEREVHAVGASKPRKVSVRVVSASNRDIPGDVAAGRFRADLYYRLRGLQFHIPPLRDRAGDLPILVAAFAESAAQEHGKVIRGVSRKAMDLLLRYSWPGNVRELLAEIHRAVLVAPDGGLIDVKALGPVQWAVGRRRSEGLEPGAGDSRSLSAPLDSSIGQDSRREPVGGTLEAKLVAIERRLIEDALAASEGNRTHAARQLGLSRNGLLKKLRRFLRTEV